MRQPFVLEDELGHIAYVIDIKPPGQMIKFVLYYGGESPAVPAWSLPDTSM